MSELSPKQAQDKLDYIWKELNQKYDSTLTERTVKLINQGKVIFLKRNNSEYIHQHSNIAAGPDYVIWTKYPNLALEIFNLKWAFAIAQLYKCKVVSFKFK